MSSNKQTKTAKPVQFGNFDDRFCDELASWVNGRRVLETFAGNGLLASMLKERGVDIISTSLLTGHDGHQRGMNFDVEIIDSIEAVKRHGAERDILLMCWPTVTEAATMSAFLWGSDKPIVFVGEVTDLEKGELGGCATDLFFDVTFETHVFEAYTAGNMLDRAAVRQLKPDAAARIDAALPAFCVASRR